MATREFQSTVDRHMAARILACTARMYLKLVRGRTASGGRVSSAGASRSDLQWRAALVGVDGGNAGAVSAPPASSGD